MICPLCRSDSELFDREKFRSYFQCRVCSLVFVPRSEILTHAQEKERYEAHENSGPGYETYLNQIISSIKPHLTDEMKGLDFGSGSSTYLSKTLKNTKAYDVYFHPDKSLLEKRYEFVIMSEVIEHLRDLEEEMRLIKTILKPGSLLFVKTKFLPEEDFSNWFYKRDRTHVQFFNQKSFRKLSELFGFSGHQEIGEDLYLFTNER